VDRPAFPVIIHFQFDGVKGWEALGAGEGSADDPLNGALDDIRNLSGGSLPGGSYRFIDPRVAGARWQNFELDAEGQVVD
jgi:hypothetical protein